MPSVAALVEEAKTALMSGESARAEQYCKHVLNYLPKHIEANCLLAEALRDRGQNAAAKDLFLRVLSADPSSLIAHWALSIIAEADHDMEWARWELQRAWESSPGHSELRQEVHRITGSKPAMSALALAQVYRLGGHADSAIEELAKAAKADPTRLDVLTLLAECLWSEGRLDEAAEVCVQILADSPDLLKANLIMGLILHARGGTDSRVGRDHLQRALALDPARVVASELLDGNVPDILNVEPADIPDIFDGQPETQSRDFPSWDDAPFGGQSDNDQTQETSAPEFNPDSAPPGQYGRFSDDGPVTPEVDVQPARNTPPAQSDSGMSEWLKASATQAQSVHAALESRLISQSVQQTTLDQIADDVDPQWQDLLTLDADLDADSEERLSRALAEMGLAEANSTERGWVEVPMGQEGLKSHLGDVGRAEESTESGLIDLAEKVSQPAHVPEPPARPKPEPVAKGSGDEATVDKLAAALRGDPTQADEVISQLRDLLSRNPNLASAHRTLGDAYMRIGRFQQAIEQYNMVINK